MGRHCNPNNHWGQCGTFRFSGLKEMGWMSAWVCVGMSFSVHVLCEGSWQRPRMETAQGSMEGSHRCSGRDGVILASLSASSFPRIPACAFTHATVWSPSLIAFLAVSTSHRWRTNSFLEDTAWTAPLLSESMVLGE